MNQEIKSLIEKELQSYIVIEQAYVTYSGAEIVDFRTCYDNGNNFVHANGDRYGLAFLNVFTTKGEVEISEVINATPINKISDIKEIIERNRLKVYIHGDTKRFLETKKGDVGCVFMKDLDDFLSVGFVNESAESRRINK